MKIFRWLITALIALVLIVFAVSNRESVAISYWPLSFMVEAPLYLVVLLALLVGFLFGELVAWMNGRRWRREARLRGRRLEVLERELATTQSQLASAQANPPAVTPPTALPRN